MSPLPIFHNVSFWIHFSSPSIGVGRTGDYFICPISSSTHPLFRLGKSFCFLFLRWILAKSSQAESSDWRCGGISRQLHLHGGKYLDRLQDGFLRRSRTRVVRLNWQKSNNNLLPEPPPLSPVSKTPAIFFQTSTWSLTYICNRRKKRWPWWRHPEKYIDYSIPTLETPYQTGVENCPRRQ